MTIEFKGFKTRLVQPERETVTGNLQRFVRDAEGNRVPVRALQDSVQFGFGSVSGGDQSVAFGPYANATGDFSIAGGFRARATGTSTVVLGNQANGK